MSIFLRSASSTMALLSPDSAPKHSKVHSKPNASYSDLPSASHR